MHVDVTPVLAVKNAGGVLLAITPNAAAGQPHERSNLRHNPPFVAHPSSTPWKRFYPLVRLGHLTRFVYQTCFAEQNGA